MKTIYFLFLLVSGTCLCAQESSKFFAYWNSPPTPHPAKAAEQSIPDVILSRSSEFEIPETARVAQGGGGQDNGLYFFMDINGKCKQLSFKPIVRSGEVTKRGTFHMLIGCGYPEFVIVSGSEAEKNLISFLRKELASKLTDDDLPTSSSNSCCEDPRPATLAALTTLLQYFPVEEKPTNKKPNKSP